MITHPLYLLNRFLFEPMRQDYIKGAFVVDLMRKYRLGRIVVERCLEEAGIPRHSGSYVKRVVNQRHRTPNQTKDIPTAFFNHWKGAALRRGIEWRLTPQDIQDQLDAQGGKCYYTGLTMAHVLRTRGVKNPYRLSLDRRSLDRPYEPGNIALCCMLVNLAKHVWDEATFWSILKRIQETTPPTT